MEILKYLEGYKWVTMATYLKNILAGIGIGSFKAGVNNIVDEHASPAPIIGVPRQAREAH
jgi:hypothetical protein